MSRKRPTLRTVTAIVLLWQLAAALLFTGPAIAATHASMHLSGGTSSHCHDSHGMVHHAAESAGVDHTSHSDHSTAPDCCAGASACHCACAQGGIADASVPTSSDTAPGRVLEPDFRSPPFVARTTEVFRPPI